MTKKEVIKMEKIEDILREARGPYYKMGRSSASLDKDMMSYMSLIANRIEKAWKREREEIMDKQLELEKEFMIEAIVKLFRAVEEAEEFVECVGSIWLNNAARFAESGKSSVLCRDGADHLMQKYNDAQKCIKLMDEARAAYEIRLRMRLKEEIDAEYEKQRKEYHKKERENHD